MSSSRLDLFESEFGSCAEPNNCGYVFRAASSLTFLMSTNRLTDQSNAASYVKCSNAFRTVQLVSGYAKKVHAEFTYIYGQATRRLN